MKKQIKKLSLSKRTISNLTSPEMGRIIGGKTLSCFHGHGCNNGGGGNSTNCTQNQNTCQGHKSCYNC